MKKQPKPFAAQYHAIGGTTDLIGNGFCVYDIPDQREEVETLVDHINKLIEERKELLEALVDLHAAARVGDADYDAVTAAAVAIEKATT